MSLGPQRRLIATLFSYKPDALDLIMSLLVLFACVVFSGFYWQSPEIAQYLAASKDLAINKHEYWRLFSTIFVHANVQHLLSNAYMLGILGLFVSAYFGFIIFPLLSVFFAALINYFALMSYPLEVNLVGASGMVYFLAGFWLTIYIFVERYKGVLKRVLRSMGIGLVILFPTSFEPQVSYRTHAIGAVVGILFAIVYFIFAKDKIRSYEKWQDIQPDPIESIEN